MGKTALVIGGGAPDFTLNTGALLAFEERGVKFDIISMCGGGGVVGLTYLAPKGLTRRDAMLDSMNAGISDSIYRFMPMNYKIFQKAGWNADLFRSILAECPGYNRIVNQFGMTPGQKLLSNWIQMIWAAMTPTTLNPWSKGLCAHTPFITEMVDFTKLENVDIDFYLSAYCLTDHKMATFGKEDFADPEVGLAMFKASLSYPFFYAPFELGNKLYIEGASRDTFNFKELLKREPDIETIVVFDAMGIDGLLHPPENLWDAFGQSIVTPLVALSRADLKLFETLHNVGPDKRNLYKIKYQIPQNYLPTALDWSSKNLRRMFNIGYKAGHKFVDAHGPLLDH
ncbi:MAG: patatin-like phospholipase family protein [Rhodospirillaceae bacterium]